MLEVGEKTTILGIRLLIARAAQKDSLNWWEDDSLTPAGGYVLERLFLAAPQEAGRKLALEAARTRYQAAFNGENNPLHLFRLDKTGEIEHGLQDIPIMSVPVPLEPIPTRDMLRQKFLEFTGQPDKFKVIGERANHRMEIRPANPHKKYATLEIVKILAWATLEGEANQPVFPYIMLTS